MTTEKATDRANPDPRLISSASEWATALATLRENVGLSVRDLAKATAARTSTLGGYFSGRHLPTPASRDLVDALLSACGVSSEVERREWLDALNRVRRIPGPRPIGAAAPYMGLAGYDVQDAPWFFGREGLIARLVEMAQSEPQQIAMVVGASGSGKSSLLRAGLEAALLDQGWIGRRVTPGSRPMQVVESLRAEISRVSGSATRVLLLVDQLEELWTAGAARLEVAAAIDVLCELAALPGVVVVAGLRADFYAAALGSPTLATALQTHQVVVGPMTLPDLRRAVTEPAARAQIDLEDGLVDILLRDLAPSGAGMSGDAYDAGALPLLSHALLQTWQRGGRHRLTVADYLATGGIAGAVSTSAEAVYTGLEEAQQELARRLFPRLVSVADETADTRRRLTYAELEGLDGGQADDGDDDAAEDRRVDAIVERYVAARLLTAGDTTVEITHEALLVAWPRLRAWLDTDREGLIIHRRLGDAATSWRAADQDPGLLLRGGQFESASAWARDPARQATLNAVERDFLAAAAVAQDHDQRERRRRNRRLQVLAGTLAAALVAVAALAAYSLTIRSGAEHDRDLALSRQLAEAANRLRTVDPTVAAQFALLGYRTSHTVEATSALLNTSAEPLDRRLEGPGGPPAVSVSGDGHLLAAVGAGGGLRLWALPGSGPHIDVTATISHVQDGPLYATALNPAGTLLAAAGTGGSVHVWDVSNPRSPRPLQTLSVGIGGILALAFSPDGHVLAATATNPSPRNTTSGQVFLWDVSSGALARHPGSPLVPGDTGLQALAFSSDSTVLAAAGDTGTTYRWIFPAVGAPRPLTFRLSGPTRPTTSLAFTPDGHALAAGSKDQKVYVWHLPNASGPAQSVPGALAGTPTATLTQAQAQINVVTFSPDGKLLAAGGSDSHLRVYDYPDLTPISDIGQPGPITAAAYTPDGRSLISGGTDGRVHIWPATPPTAGIANGRTFGVAYTAGGHDLIALTSRNSIRVFDTSQPFATRPITDTLTSPTTEPFAGTLAASPNRHLIASGGQHGTTWLYGDTAANGRLPLIAALPKAQSAFVESASFADGGDTLLTADDHSTIQITDVNDPSHPHVIGTPAKTKGIVYALASSPDGHVVASGTGTTGLVELWDLSDPSHAHVLADAPTQGSPTLQVYGLAFSPDGRTLAVGAADHTVRLLDVTHPAAPHWLGSPLSGAADYVFAVQFSPDGRALASASNDGTLRLYDTTHLDAPVQTAALTGPTTTALYSVAFSPAGNTIATGGATEALLTWTLKPEQAAHRICTQLDDPIPPDEWHRYLPSVPYAQPCL